MIALVLESPVIIIIIPGYAASRIRSVCSTADTCMQQQVLKFPQDVKIPLAGMHAYSKIEAAATCRLESPCRSPNSARSYTVVILDHACM